MLHHIKSRNSLLLDIDTIIFDFDGTLADTQKATMMTFLQVLGELDLILDKRLFCEEMTALSVEDMFRSAGLNGNLVARACERYRELYRIIAPRFAHPFSGVKTTLEALDSWGFKLAIATNESRANLDMLLSAFGITSLFVASCCADEVARSKPFPDMGIKILKALKTDPENTMMVGDSIFDMAMGKSLGLYTCAAGYGAYPISRLLEHGPNSMIMEFRELLTLLPGPELMGTVSHERLETAN